MAVRRVGAVQGALRAAEETVHVGRCVVGRERLLAWRGQSRGEPQPPGRSPPP
jgi:hypothetical protein